MSRPLTRLLRVRRLMEEMSRAEFAYRRIEQAELEMRREEARETALVLRSEARTAMIQAAMERDATPGLWQRYLTDSEFSVMQMKRWGSAAETASMQADEAQRKYLEDRRSRMQAEILVRERISAERLEQQRREQQETDDWFGMRRDGGRKVSEK